MGSELNIEVTEQELAYRSKNYSDLKAFEKRELFCSSCGNILSHDSRHVYSHPIFDILQCENCNNHFKTVTFSSDKDDSVRNCHLCGRERTSSYGCVKPDCPYEFCKTCIKRNVPQSLVDAESGKWKCFVCNAKPLWKLRGACAAIMSSLPKRTKSKKVKSRKRSSDREDERSDLKDRSYVRRTQLERTKKLSKKLSLLCDNDSPNQLEEKAPRLSLQGQSSRANKNGNDKVKAVGKFVRFEASGRVSRDTSSDDSDKEEIVRLKSKMVKTKFQRENSTERTKLRSRKRKSEERVRERKDARNDSVGNPKRGVRGSIIGGNGSLQELDNSSDESDVEEVKPKKSSTTKTNVEKKSSKSKKKSHRYESSESSDDEAETHKNESKRTSKAKTMPVTSKKQTFGRGETRDKGRNSRTVSRSSRRDASSDSSSDDSVTASLKRMMPTAFATKPKTNEKNNSTSSKRKESSGEEEPSKKNAVSSKPTRSSTIKSSDASSKSNKKRHSKRSESVDRDDSASQSRKKLSKLTEQNVSVILNDVANIVEKNSRKTLAHLRLNKKKQGSDSSSGKEFRSSKVCSRSVVGFHRIQDIEEDRTMSPPESSKEDINDEIPKGQSFALKKSVRGFFAELKTSATKLLNDVEHAQKTYFPKDESMRESMRPVDANRMMLEAKKVLCTWKQCVEQGETKITDYYGGWCKKTRQRNIWKSPRTADRERKPSTSEQSEGKRNSTNSEDSGSKSSASTKIASQTENETRTKSPESVVANGEKPVVVSDCDSEEIFSNDETRMSINKSIAASPDKDNKDTSANLESTKKNDESNKLELTYSSEESEAAADEDKDIDDKPAEEPEITEKTASPTMSQFSGRSDAEDERPKQDANELRSRSGSPVHENEERESVNDSPDIFETSVGSSVDDPEKPSSYQEELDKIKKNNSIKLKEGKSTVKKSKSTASGSDSESASSKKASSRAPSPAAHESDSSKKASSRARSPAAHESDGSRAASSRAASPAAHESDSSKKASSRAASTAAHESDSTVKASSRAASPAANESDSTMKASSRAASPAANESDSSKEASSRAPSPAARDSDGSKEASLRARSPAAREADNSKKASSRAPSPATHESEDSKDIEATENIDNNTDVLSDANTEEYFNPLDLVEAVVEENEVASDSENSEIPTAVRTSVEKSAEKEPSEGENVATESYLSSSGKKSDAPADESHSSPDTVACDVLDDEKQMETSEEATGRTEEKSKKLKSRKSRKKVNDEKGSDLTNRSSPNTVSTDDPKVPEKKSKSRNDSGASSELSDADNARAREAMLMSSNSDDSSAEQESRTRNSNPKEPHDSPLTPPESDSKSDKSSKSLERNSNERDSEGCEKMSGSDKPRKKRSKFRINKNRYYIADEQLKQMCEVRVERLGKKILERYARALRKSKKYVESKEIERLVTLDKLDKDTKRVTNSSSEDEDSSKGLKRNKKKTRAKEREETLMDHLEKVKNGESIVLSSASEDEGSKSGKKKDKSKDNGEDSLFAEANRMAKKRMLDSSESADEEQPDSDAKDDEPVKSTKKVTKKEKLSKSSEDEEEKKEKAEKGRWRRNKILTLKISDSDSDEERKKFDLAQAKLAKKKKTEGSDSDEETSSKKKKRVRRRVLHSDSEVSPISNSDSDSSGQSIKKKKKKKKDDSSDEEKEEKKKSRKRSRRTRSSDSSMDEKRPKVTRRKRIKTAGSDSDSDEDLDNSQGSPGKSGRKNIRKVLRDKQVAEDTKQAAKDEEERLKRIADRQKLYNEMYEVRLAGEEKVEKLVLDFDEETKEPLVSVDEGLVKRLKPHQAQGIKFMWDACFESLERSKNTKGSGCILAHCMGLGKSFQVVTLTHTLLMHRDTGINTVLVVCPLSTVLNWANEFKIWLADLPSVDDIEIYELTKMKKNYERKYQLERWRETGGVMIIGYEMFRNLSTGGKKVRKNIQESFIKSLVDPGPDLIVCDEGHLLKKEDTALSKAMRKVKTLRRIVLTGTPLQNNLIEYHCMVQFVKPNLLGTKREFMNRFENPITNGQFDDSTEYDVKLMKKRAHVLHKMLEGSVQRFDYSVLMPFLPPKQEYVIFVKLTEIQTKMYQHYLENYARRHRGVGGSLFADFQALQRIWTHPMVMQMNAEKVERANEKKRLDASDSEGSLRDFIDDGSDTPCSSNSSDVQSASGSEDEKSKKKPTRSTRANPVVEEPSPPPAATEENNDEVAWWTQFVNSDADYEDIRISSKLLILFRILKESEQIGDKVLVFSQSLYSLTLIEKFLGMIDDETQKGSHPEYLDGHSGSWALGLDYFRLDGQSSADNRRLWCNVFNKPSNTRARLFLISTRAGGLGINLTAANRVIIFDASWNPSHDVQSIFRIYRFGQKKPCYVYRLLAAGTMEEKIYNRQVTKLSLSCRVVDEQQIERHYSNNALAELYKLELPSQEETTLNLPKDRLLAEIFLKYKHTVENYHEHDSLLENQAGEELDEEERQQAWLEYEEEKKGKRVAPPMPFMNQEQLLMQQINMMNLAQQQNILNNPAMIEILQQYQGFMQKDYPGLPDAQHTLMAKKALYDMYNSVERQTILGQRQMPMMNMPAAGGGQFVFDNQIQGPPPVVGHPSMDTLRMYQQSLAQAQNGQMNNYSNNQGQLRDALGLARQAPIAQVGQMTGLSTNASSVDDDIVEIPSSPDRNPVPSGSAPGGSGKSKEE